MRLLLTLCAFALASCAGSVGELGQKAPAKTFESKKDAQAVANCFALSINGGGEALRLSDDHYVVTRKNGYGMIMVRWDFINVPGGSRIELRSQTPFGEGEDKAQWCARGEKGDPPPSIG